MMEKSCRTHIISAAEQILGQCMHEGEFCYLSTNQIAYLINDRYPRLKGDLPVGGKGEGDKHKSGKSLLWYVAQYLKKDRKFERQWFCTERLDSFAIDGITSSDKNISMFRLRQGN